MTTRLALATLVGIAIVGVIWLSKVKEDANTTPAVSTVVLGSAGRDGDSSQSQISDFRTSARDGAVPSLSARSPSSQAAAQSIPAVRLRFEAPTSVSVGQAFDYLVVVDARQSVGRISLQITYDPALLRVRNVEEVDYASRAGIERNFVAEESSDGRVSLFFEVRPGSRAMVATERLAVAQFEAIASGWAQVGVENVDASDISHKALSVAVPDARSLIAVN